MFAKTFWKDAAERAVKTTAQVAAAVIVAAQADNQLGIGIVNIDWMGVVSVALLSGILSLLSSIASAPVGSNGTASLVDLGPKK